MQAHVKRFLQRSIQAFPFKEYKENRADLHKAFGCQPFTLVIPFNSWGASVLKLHPCF